MISSFKILQWRQLFLNCEFHYKEVAKLPLGVKRTFLSAFLCTPKQFVDDLWRLQASPKPWPSKVECSFHRTLKFAITKMKNNQLKYTGVPVSVLQISRSTAVSVQTKVRIPGPQGQVSTGPGIRTKWRIVPIARPTEGLCIRTFYPYLLFKFGYRDPLFDLKDLVIRTQSRTKGGAAQTAAWSASMMRAQNSVFCLFCLNK